MAVYGSIAKGHFFLVVLVRFLKGYLGCVAVAWVMKSGQVVRVFSPKGGREVVLRTPRWEDLDDLLELINSLVEERAEIIVDTKAYTSRFGNKEDEIVTTTYPSPSAWFEVIVRNKTTGEIVLQDGYGVNYTQDYFKRNKILTTGNYQIDFRGNDVTTDIAMRVKE